VTVTLNVKLCMILRFVCLLDILLCFVVIDVWFRQSSREDTVGHSGAATPAHNTNSTGPNGTSQNYETTFDVDGNVETVSTSSLGNKEETRSQRSVSSSRDGNR
jgi:hypothetical protein